jgi:hypothetical protein
MNTRSVASGLLLLAVGGLAGYSAAVLTGGPVPLVLQQIRYRSYARVDEARLRSALDAGENALRHTAITIGRGGTVAASVTLAQAIRFSRGQSLRGRSFPLSPQDRELYAPFFPPEMLSKVRWTVADRRPGLGSVLAGWYYREGAVTLGDVIVFSNREAAGHKALMAHELTHALQYEQLGVDDFARLYTINWPLLEHQARRNARRILDDIERDETSGSGELAARTSRS